MHDSAKFLIWIVAFIGISLAIGLRFSRLVVEDGIFETLSALMFFGAAALAAVLAMRSGKQKPEMGRRTLWGLVAFNLLLGFSEISFGARLFGFQMPEMAGGGELDGGHDLAILAVRHIAGWTIGQRILLAAGVVLILGGITWLNARAAKNLAARLWNNPIYLRIACAFALLGAALLLDVINRYSLNAIEEVLEMSAALSMFAAFFGAVRWRPVFLDMHRARRSADG
ncbi:hypothetical protein D2T29_13740 [Sinirhodobacter populi]|uniref:Uncharacterized protein n=1 Tax=Paenirhodobacter populi TaxID=2306993 RepID=A0A443KAN7_9RHOB|nr:hypothetical protein [Sinirhodobacter populi]RWR29844.1 hypothetical protein D2T29_13740 [Sinirhodobacter populi]